VPVYKLGVHSSAHNRNDANLELGEHPGTPVHQICEVLGRSTADRESLSTECPGRDPPAWALPLSAGPVKASWTCPGTPCLHSWISLRSRNEASGCPAGPRLHRLQPGVCEVAAVWGMVGDHRAGKTSGDKLQCCPCAYGLHRSNLAVELRCRLEALTRPFPGGHSLLSSLEGLLPPSGPPGLPQ
jgi:hypothetical protein